MTKNTSPYAEKSRLLGSLLSRELSKVYRVQDELKKVPGDRKVWVLDAPEITYPSLLVEFGNLQNTDDMKFIKSVDNQEKVARQVLNAVALFAERK